MNTVQRSLAAGAAAPAASSPTSLTWTAEPLRLLLDEAAGAGGADRVHDRGGDPACLQGGELRVLPADLDDRVDLGSSSKAARAWAVISSTTRSAPMIAPMNLRPEPVVPAPRDRERDLLLALPSRRSLRRAPAPPASGSPGGARVDSRRGPPRRSSSSTALVLVEPMSTPRKARQLLLGGWLDVDVHLHRSGQPLLDVVASHSGAAWRSSDSPAKRD